MATVKIEDLFRSPETNDRKRAIILLVQSGMVEAIPWLEKLASSDSDTTIRYFARKGLDQMQATAGAGTPGATPTSIQQSEISTLEGIQTALKSPDPVTVMNGLKGAAGSRDPQLVPALLPLLATTVDPRLAAAAVTVLGLVASPDAVRGIIAALKASDHRVRANAVEALANLNRPEHLPLLVPFLSDQDNRVRGNAARSLTAAGTAAALGTLERMLASPDVAWRDSATFALSLLNSDQAVELLEQAADDADPGVASKAIGGLRRLAQKGQAAATLAVAKRQARANAQPASDSPENLLGSLDLGAAAVRDDLAARDPAVRLKAAFSASQDGNKDAVGPLLARLKVEADPKVKATIISAVGGLGQSAEVVPVLLPFLKDPDDRTRANTVEILGRHHIDAPGVVAALIPLLDDENNRTKTNAILSLRKSLGAMAYQRLSDMAADSEPFLRRSALFALDELGGPEAVEPVLMLAIDADIAIRKRAIEVLGRLAANNVPTAAEALAKAATHGADRQKPPGNDLAMEAAQVGGRIAAAAAGWMLGAARDAASGLKTAAEKMADSTRSNPADAEHPRTARAADDPLNGQRVGARTMGMRAAVTKSPRRFHYAILPLLLTIGVPLLVWANWNKSSSSLTHHEGKAARVYLLSDVGSDEEIRFLGDDLTRRTSETLADAGFAVIDPSQTRETSRLSLSSRDFEGASVVSLELCRKIDAEVLILMHSDIENVDRSDGKLVSAKLSVGIRAVWTDSGEIFANSRETGETKPGTSLKETLLSLAKTASEKLAGTLATAWKNRLSDGRTLQARVEVVDSLQLDWFRKALSEVSGVKSVDQRSFEDGTAILAVAFQGTPQSLTERCSALSGDNKVIVLAATQNEVRFKLVKVEKKETGVPVIAWADSYDDLSWLIGELRKIDGVKSVAQKSFMKGEARLFISCEMTSQAVLEKLPKNTTGTRTIVIAGSNADVIGLKVDTRTGN